MSREATKKILDMIDEGILDARTIARDLLGYLSEDDVEDFAHHNDLLIDEEFDEEFDDEEDSDPEEV